MTPYCFPSRRRSSGVKSHDDTQTDMSPPAPTGTDIMASQLPPGSHTRAQLAVEGPQDQPRLEMPSSASFLVHGGGPPRQAKPAGQRQLVRDTKRETKGPT